MFETVILNANIIFPGRNITHGNIGISNGKIKAITGTDIKIKGSRTIDATNKYVFPGIIEPHSHIGIGAGEEDLLTETGSASIGGVTTVLFFLRENTPYDEPFKKVRLIGEEKSFIDFSFHIVLITEDHLESVPKFINDFGITSFKLYMTFRGEDAKTTNFGGNSIGFGTIDDGYILESFQYISKYPKAIALVHAENIEIIQRLRKNLKRTRLSDLEIWANSRPVIAELESVRRILGFAKETGCRINILHLTSKEALNEAISFRKTYSDIYLEVCHPYLVFNKDDITSKKYKLRPPIRTKKDKDALWKAVKDGEVYTIGSDHVPRKLGEKMGDILSPAAGSPGSPYLFPVILSEGHHKRQIPLTDIANVLSLNPAKLYGLYPQKGDICINSDADLVIVDLEKEYVLKASDINQYSDFILYEGLSVKGYPELTMIRGNIVAENGKIVGKAGWGKFIPR